MPVQIGYWKIRGLATPLRMLMEHIGQPYENVYYEQTDAPEFNCDAWFSVKFNLGLEFPNLPYIKDEEFHMTETIPIMQYLADKYKPELLGADAQQRAKVNMVTSVVVGVKNATTGPCYSTGDISAVIGAAKKGLEPIVKFLGNNKFLTGESVTFIDFYFWEMLQAIRVSYPDLCTDFPTLAVYHETVRAVSGVKEYFDKEDCPEHTLSFNNKSAKINATVKN